MMPSNISSGIRWPFPGLSILPVLLQSLSLSLTLSACCDEERSTRQMEMPKDIDI